MYFIPDNSPWRDRCNETSPRRDASYREHPQISSSIIYPIHTKLQLKDVLVDDQEPISFLYLKLTIGRRATLLA